MSELNDFVNMCSCVVQFYGEYPPSCKEDRDILAFCSYVTANRPFEQLKSQFEAYAVKYQKLLATGILVDPDNDGNIQPGAIFAQTDACIVISTEDGNRYSLDFGQLGFLIHERIKGKRVKGDVKRDPNVVCSYSLGVISKCLRMSVVNSDIEPRIRNSIAMNSKKEWERHTSPYTSDAIANLRKLGSRLLQNEAIKPSIDSMIGEGTADRASKVIQDFDARALTSSNTTGEIVSAITRGDDNALIATGKALIANVVESVYDSSLHGDPSQQC